MVRTNRLIVFMFMINCLAIVVLEGAASLARSESEPVPMRIMQEGDPSLPCRPVWQRSYEPMAVQQGDTVKVRVWYDFDCAKASDLANIMLVVNNSVENDFNNRQGLERNMRTGLQEFVGRVNFDAGSAVGLELFNATALTRSPLRSGAAHRQALLFELENFRIGFGTAEGMADAIFDAYKQLPTQDAEQKDRNWMIIFDTGAQPGGPGDRCTIAQRAGIKVVGVQLPAAQGRLVACATNGLLTAADNEGSNLSDLFNSAAELILRGSTIESTIVNEYYRTEFVDFVEGSESVPYSSHFGNSIDWIFAAAAHPRGGAGQSLSYELRIKEEDLIAPDVIKISDDSPDIWFAYSGGNGFQRRNLPNPEICVYRPGKQMEDCGQFLITPTLPATATPTSNLLDTPTPTPTTKPATMTPSTTPDLSTPTSSATRTPEPCAGCTIFLPLLANEHDA